MHMCEQRRIESERENPLSLGYNSVPAIQRFQELSEVFSSNRTPETPFLEKEALIEELRERLRDAVADVLFEANTKNSQQQFRYQAEKYLNEMIGQRKLYAFRIVCDGTNNTQEVIADNKFVAKVYVQPTPALQYIQLELLVIHGGVPFEEIGEQV